MVNGLAVEVVNGRHLRLMKRAADKKGGEEEEEKEEEAICAGINTVVVEQLIFWPRPILSATLNQLNLDSTLTRTVLYCT